MSNRYVYILRDPRKNNEPFYVGKGTGNRAWQHFGESVGAKSNPLRYRTIQSIKREGLDGIVEIYASNLTDVIAYQLEIELIAQFGTQALGTGNLTNLTPGGEGAAEMFKTKAELASINAKRSATMTGVPKSAQHVSNISKAKTGENNPMYGKDSPFKGKSHSEDTKKKIGATRSGSKASEATKAKMAASRKGKPRNSKKII